MGMSAVYIHAVHSCFLTPQSALCVALNQSVQFLLCKIRRLLHRMASACLMFCRMKLAEQFSSVLMDYIRQLPPVRDIGVVRQSRTPGAGFP